jgi:ribonuclease-3
VFGFFKRKSPPTVSVPHNTQQLLNQLNLETNQPDLYTQALRHKSLFESTHSNNERLEFLGDSILDMVVTEYLFEKFPDAREGFLTRLRSRIVSRSSLNKIGISLNLHTLIESNMGRDIKDTALSGNAFEALIGAMYLDKGLRATADFLIQHVFETVLDFEALMHTEIDHKSRLLEFCQKHQYPIEFVTEMTDRFQPLFESKVLINHEELATAKGPSKKKAEQNCAAQALQKIH